MALREAAAETLREARRAASVYDDVRLKEAAACYLRLAGCRYAEAATLMLKPGERAGSRSGGERRERRLEHLAPEVRWTVERPKDGQRRRGTGRGRRQRALVAAWSLAGPEGGSAFRRGRKRRSPRSRD